MKIDKISAGALNQSTLRQAVAKPEKYSSHVAQTDISSDVALINQGMASIAGMDAIDTAKVEGIKSALEKGEIQLDMGALSEAIQQFHANQK